MAQDPNIKDLAKIIRARRRLLEQIINPIISLVNEIGKEMNKPLGHPGVVRQLKNFYDFTFYINLGQSTFGGNIVDVYHHPGRKFREGGLDSAYDQYARPVLRVYFQPAIFSSENCQVEIFVEDRLWQVALRRIIKNKDKLVEKMTQVTTKSTEQQKKRELRGQKILKEREKIKEEARKLRIIPPQ